MTVLFCQIIQAQTPNTCCPPLTKTELMNNLFYEFQTPGSMTSPYKITFKPTTGYKDQMSAYVKYLTKLCPSKKFVISYEFFKVPAIGSIPTGASTHAVCAEWHIFTNGSETINDVDFGASAYCVAAESALSGKWFQRGDVYCFKVRMVNEPGPNCFSNGCDPGLIWVRIPNFVEGGPTAKMSSPSSSKLEIHDESGLKLSK